MIKILLDHGADKKATVEDLYHPVDLLSHDRARAKGQLISKCPHEKSVSSKIPTKLFLDFCPEIFCSFLGASWKLSGLPWT